MVTLKVKNVDTALKCMNTRGLANNIMREWAVTDQSNSTYCLWGLGAVWLDLHSLLASSQFPSPMTPNFSGKHLNALHSVQAVAFRELFIYVHVYALFLCRSIPRLDLQQESIKERDVAK